MGLNTELLERHIRDWKEKLARDPERAERDKSERAARVAFYQSKSAVDIRRMTADDFYEYIAKLWAMLIWGNKKYLVDKLIEDNGFDTIKNELAELIWATRSIENRWDHFR